MGRYARGTWARNIEGRTCRVGTRHDIGEYSAVLIAVVARCSREAVAGVCRIRDIAPVRSTIGADLPLDRRGWVANRSGSKASSVSRGNRRTARILSDARSVIDRQGRRTARRRPGSVGEDRSVLFAIVTRCSREAVGGVCRIRDIAPVRSTVGAELPLVRRGWIARGRSGKARRCVRAYRRTARIPDLSTSLKEASA